MEAQASAYLNRFMNELAERNPGEREFHQAVYEVAESLAPYLVRHPKLMRWKILERIAEPERVVIFRVPWLDDHGRVRINRGYRVQMNSAIGPYKGGLRFDPSVDLSILKFLAFEQVFKNSLTTLPLGGGKGGADFDPKRHSDEEVMRFCQSFMTELQRHIGQFTDIPAGDLGVGGREIGYLFGQYRRMRDEFAGVLTGKGLASGGSPLRPEATGYGLCYFVQAMLSTRGEALEGKRVVISGAGNVAQYAALKAIELGARVLTLSDSEGYVYDPEGIDQQKMEYVLRLKNEERGRIGAYAERYPAAAFRRGRKPWEVPCQIALPCATQNELDASAAAQLLANGCRCVAEGANMPCTPEAIAAFNRARILFAPAKAANAGGVATSGLEMAQNAMHLGWSQAEVDERLRRIMQAIHDACVEHGTEQMGYVNYVHGANIAAFIKVADAMLAQGLV